MDTRVKTFRSFRSQQKQGATWWGCPDDSITRKAAATRSKTSIALPRLWVDFACLKLKHPPVLLTCADVMMISGTMGRFTVNNENIFEALRFNESIHDGIPVTIIFHILKKKPKTKTKAKQRNDLQPEVTTHTINNQAITNNCEKVECFQTTSSTPTLAKLDSVHKTSLELADDSFDASRDVTPSRPLLGDVISRSRSDDDTFDDIIDQLNRLSVQVQSASRESVV